MTQSSHSLIQVLCYHELSDSAFWCTPSEASRQIAADEFVTVIEPFDKNYDAVCKLAGPKPERIVTIK